MYNLKQSPEDFIVKEISNLDLKDKGNYAVCLLKKRNYTTIRAIEQIARVLNKKIKDIGFAGTKDKNAVTEQFISIKDVNKERIEKIRLKDIELKFLGYLDKPVSLGDLEGNEFIITIRNLKEKEIVKLENKIREKCLMPNYFGKQRFSENNVKIGKSLLKSDFKEALRLILDTNPDYKYKMQEFINKNPNNFVGALKLMPKKLLLLYVHAYQSYLWNKALNEYKKTNNKNIKIPLIGFGIEIENREIWEIINELMKKENITFRTFINKQIPEISLEGNLRDAFVEIKDLKILERLSLKKTNPEKRREPFDEGKNFVKIGFSLQKGSYATVAIEFLLN